MNPLKNEFLLSIGGREILLRPTFENMVNTESKVGAIAHLAWRLTQVSPFPTKQLLGFSEMVMIIYYMQAAHEKAEGKTPLTMGEIYELAVSEGVIKLVAPLLEFLGKVTAGNKQETELSESVKKN